MFGAKTIPISCWRAPSTLLKTPPKRSRASTTAPLATASASVWPTGPAIVPGTRDDKDGCEDPTLERVDGRYYVYYSGWDETKKVGQLMLAVGETVDNLRKQGVKLRSTNTHTNPKEATLVAAEDGS